MVRWMWMLMLLVFFTARGCDQKSADQTPTKVTSDDVSRDAGQVELFGCRVFPAGKARVREEASAPDSRNWTRKSLSSARRVAT